MPRYQTRRSAQTKDCCAHRLRSLAHVADGAAAAPRRPRAGLPRRSFMLTFSGCRRPSRGRAQPSRLGMPGCTCSATITKLDAMRRLHTQSPSKRPRTANLESGHAQYYLKRGYCLEPGGGDAFIALANNATLAIVRACSPMTRCECTTGHVRPGIATTTAIGWRLPASVPASVRAGCSAAPMSNAPILHVCNARTARTAERLVSSSSTKHRKVMLQAKGDDSTPEQTRCCRR